MAKIEVEYASDGEDEFAAAIVDALEKRVTAQGVIEAATQVIEAAKLKKRSAPSGSAELTELNRIIYDAGMILIGAREAADDLGGPGSGFFGHAGRDAENLRGGSVAKGRGGGDALDRDRPLNKTTLHSLADQMIAADAAGEEAGFSYQPESEDLNPPTGFMSSEYENLNEAIPIGEFNDERLATYAVKNKKYFRDHNLYLGGWVSGGDVYLDVSQRFESRDDALKSAIDHWQLGVFDLSTKKTIYTSTKFDPKHANYDRAIEQAFKKKRIPYPGP